MASVTPGVAGASALAYGVGGAGIVLEGTGSGVIAPTPSTPLTTSLNDCLIVFVSAQGTAGITASGASATWVEAVYNNPAGPELAVWVGYGCGAGATALSLSYSAGSGTYVIGQLSGVLATGNPVVTGIATSVGSGNTSLTTASVSYLPYELIAAAAAVFGPGTWSTSTWSDNVPTTSFGSINTGGGRDIAADFIIPVNGGSTTATYGWTGSTNANGGILVLQHANALLNVIVTPGVAAASAVAYNAAVGTANVVPITAAATATAYNPIISGGSGATNEGFSAWLPVQFGFLQFGVVPGSGELIAEVAGATAHAFGSPELTISAGAGAPVKLSGQLPVQAGLFELGGMSNPGIAYSTNASAAAYAPSSILEIVLAGPAAASATVYTPAASVTFTPQVAAASATAYNLGIFASPVTAGASAAAYGPSLGPVVPTTAMAMAQVWDVGNAIGQASVTVGASAVAHAPTVTTSGGVVPISAAASTTAYAPGFAAQPAVPVAATSAVAYAQTASVTISPIGASVTATAYAPDITTNAETTVVPIVGATTALAYGASASVTAASINAAASATAGTSTAAIAFVSLVGSASASASSVTFGPSVTPGVAAATATAIPPIFLAPGTGAASATVYEPAISVYFSPLVSAASATAQVPSIAASVVAPATNSATALAIMPAAGIVITPQVAAAAATAAIATAQVAAFNTALAIATANGADTFPPDFFVNVFPEVASAIAVGNNASVSGGFVLVTPIVAQATAEANNATPYFIKSLRSWISTGMRPVNVSTVPVPV